MSKTASRQRLLMPLAALALAALAALWLLDARVGRLWLNTAWLATGAALVALPIGTLAAVAIFKTDTPGRRFAALVFVAMLFLPLFLVTGAWDAGFGIQGWHTLANNPRLAHVPWLAGWRAAVWVHAMAAVPWVVLLVGAGLRAVEAELEEDAALCASPARVIWRVSLPRSAAAIAVAGLWVAVVASAEISITDFFQVRTFAEEVYTQAALGAFDVSGEPGAGSRENGGMTNDGMTNDGMTNDGMTNDGMTNDERPAENSDIRLSSFRNSSFGLWLGLLLSTILALAVMFAARQTLAELTEPPHRPPWTWHLGHLRWPAAFALALVVLLVAGVPIANLLYKAGVTVTATDTGRVREWSAAKVVQRTVAAPRQFRGELELSAALGTAAATSAVAIGLPLAWSLRLARRVPWIRLATLALCFTIPGPLLGIGLIHLLNQSPDSLLAPLSRLYDSYFAPWLVQTLRALPAVTLVLWTALTTVPQVMLDAAATDGTGWWGRLLRIALPQRWPALAAAWLIGLTIAVGELAATVLVMPPARSTTISIRLFQLLHYGVDDRLAAISLVVVAAVATLAAVAAALIKKTRPSS